MTYNFLRTDNRGRFQSCTHHTWIGSKHNTPKEIQGLVKVTSVDLQMRGRPTRMPARNIKPAKAMSEFLSLVMLNLLLLLTSFARAPRNERRE